MLKRLLLAAAAFVFLISGTAFAEAYDTDSRAADDELRYLEELDRTTVLVDVEGEVPDTLAPYEVRVYFSNAPQKGMYAHIYYDRAAHKYVLHDTARVMRDTVSDATYVVIPEDTRNRFRILYEPVYDPASGAPFRFSVTDSAEVSGDSGDVVQDDDGSESVLDLSGGKPSGVLRIHVPEGGTLGNAVYKLMDADSGEEFLIPVNNPVDTVVRLPFGTYTEDLSYTRAEGDESTREAMESLSFFWFRQHLGADELVISGDGDVSVELRLYYQSGDDVYEYRYAKFSSLSADTVRESGAGAAEETASSIYESAERDRDASREDAPSARSPMPIRKFFSIVLLGGAVLFIYIRKKGGTVKQFIIYGGAAFIIFMFVLLFI